jgi:hypothetical protein
MEDAGKTDPQADGAGEESSGNKPQGTTQGKTHPRKRVQNAEEKRHQEEAEDKRLRDRRWRRFCAYGPHWIQVVLTTLAIVVAACYTWVAHEQLATSKEQFIVDERPYVGYFALNLNYGPNTVYVTAVIQNFGKTPAIHVMTRSALYVAINEATTPAQRMALAVWGATYVPSGNAPVVAPTQQVRSTVQSNPIVSPAIMNYVRTQPWGWVLAGRITYDDRYGRQYWTTYCLYSDGKGNGEFCPRDNNSD